MRTSSSSPSAASCHHRHLSLGLLLLLAFTLLSSVSTDAFLWKQPPSSIRRPMVPKPLAATTTTDEATAAAAPPPPSSSHTTTHTRHKMPFPTVDRRSLVSSSAGLVASSWLLQQTLSAPPAAQAAPPPSSLCDDAISHLRNPKTGRDIYLIGTAHISNASAILVRKTIQEIRPQTVMLELDESRIGRIANPPSPSSSSTTATPQPSPSPSSQASTSTTNLPPPKFISPPPPPGSPTIPTNRVLVAKEDGKAGFLTMALGELTRAGSSLRERLVGVGAVVVGSVISSLYKSLDKMGFVSGQEFIVAIEEGRKVGADLLLGDRNVQVTLRRLSEALSKSELVKIREMESPTRSPAVKELEARGIKVGNNVDELSVAVEALKERASVRNLMATLKSELPEVYKAMIEERDAYMANSLLQCQSKVIVGVVGMGHLDGLERNLGGEGFQVVPCRLGGGGK